MPNFIDAVSGLRVRLGPPPVPPSHRRPSLPAVDVEETMPAIGGPGADYVAELVEIAYVDSAGGRSRRRVTLRKLSLSGGDIYIGAFCHERGAYRTFIASRVAELVDLSTGEVFDEASSFFAQHVLFADRADAGAFDAIRPDLAVLTFIARSDGEFCDEEVEAIVDYVAGQMSAPDLHAIERSVRRHFPDEDAFDRALAVIAKRDDRALARFAQAVGDVVSADGMLARSEAGLLSDLQTALEAQGINLRFAT